MGTPTFELRAIRLVLGGLVLVVLAETVPALWVLQALGLLGWLEPEERPEEYGEQRETKNRARAKNHDTVVEVEMYPEAGRRRITENVKPTEASTIAQSGLLGFQSLEPLRNRSGMWPNPRASRPDTKIAAKDRPA